MFNLSEEIKNTLKLALIAATLIACFYGGKFLQSRNKAIKIYSSALEDFKNKNYSNSYYLFSRINPMSKIKPAALYRQAQCAGILDDSESEEVAYKTLISRYPNNELSTDAQYRLGQILINKNPKDAKKYFKNVIKSHSQNDYKIASEYYLAKIMAFESPDKKEEIENSFRQYLTQYPDGRLAPDVIKTWREFDSEIKPDDLILIAKSYYKSGNYNEAEKILSNTDLKKSWAIQGANYIKKGQAQKGKSIILDGISENGDKVNKSDYNNAIEEYIKTEQDYYQASSYLLGKAKGKNKDYIWNIKCKHSPKSSRLACYEQLYANFPKGQYAQNSMENIILGRILNKNYGGAKTVADDYILKYPEGNNIDMVMFWRAKIEQKYSHNPQFDILYRNVINNFPDSYYAYRAFWITKSLNNAVIQTKLDVKPVEFPYRYPLKNSLLYNLILVQDYDLIKKITDDEFIKSWAEYKQGHYMTSVYTAQKAMEKIKNKPPKTDVRWRLVYPMNYYNQIRNNAANYNNDLALIMSLIREESHFNTYAQSGVGAIGLMQLMPSTAHDVGVNFGLSFNTTDLFNPELNIKLGNIYYSSLRKMANGLDLSAVAGYNGGMGSVQRWKKTLSYSDTDEFVEQIPYDETRNYVKKVFRSYWNYVRIYQH